MDTITQEQRDEMIDRNAKAATFGFGAAMSSPANNLGREDAEKGIRRFREVSKVAADRVNKLKEPLLAHAAEASKPE